MAEFATLDFPDRPTATPRRRTLAPGAVLGPRLAEILRPVDLPAEPEPRPAGAPEATEEPAELVEPVLTFTEAELARACATAAATAADAARDQAQAECRSEAQRLRAQVADAIQALQDSRAAMLAQGRELTARLLREAARRMLAGVLAERAPEWLEAVAGEPWERLAEARLAIHLPAADRELWAEALAPLALRADLVLTDQPAGPLLHFEREPGWLEVDLGRWLEGLDVHLREALAPTPSPASRSAPP